MEAALMTTGANKMLLILIDETDMWHDLHLYEALVRTLERHGIAGATVLSGIMGFGVHRRIHRKGLFGVADERPVSVMVVEQEAKLREVLPVLLPMVDEGLVTLQDCEVLSMGARHAHAVPA